MLLKKILKGVKERYLYIQETLCKSEVIENKNKFQELTKELSKLTPLIELYNQYEDLLKKKSESEELLKNEKDPELRELASSEKQDLEKKIKELERKILKKLFLEDTEEKSIIVEIRQGAGGKEASLFAKDLFRMYSKFAQKKSWKLEVLSSHPTDIGGFKEIIFSVKGKGVWSAFKFESGVHRVQRVPITESSGRIHTSTASVVVLEEPKEVDLQIDPKDLKIEVFRASGPGGQHVNVTDSAVRITHIPTQITVSCQDERSQIRNREKAMRILRARLIKYYKEKQEKEMSAKRKAQIGTAERSEKIRTYNFPENRVTDHRISLTLYKLEEILEGELDEIIEALSEFEIQEKLKKFLNENSKET